MFLKNTVYKMALKKPNHIFNEDEPFMVKTGEKNNICKIINQYYHIENNRDIKG